MDPLTHTAVGLFLSRAGLNRWTPHATAVMLVASNFPDCDIVSLAGGSASYLEWHRHLTHSLVAAPVMALLSVAVVRLLFRRTVAWRGAFFAALIGVASHLLLDLTNSYGVRILLPFSSDWYHFDIAGFPDPWTWTILGLGVAGPFLSRLVDSEISSGAGRVRSYGRGGAIFALTMLLLYDGTRAVLHERAVSTLESRLYQGAEPGAVAACPSNTNPLLWRGIVDTPTFYAYADVNLLTDFDPSHASILRKPDPEPAIGAARATRPFRVFLAWAQFPLWQVWPSDQVENGKQVELLDLRFGPPTKPAFQAKALLDATGRVTESSIHY